ncbi:MAG TPA: M28 family peptidase [Phycisphaerae bacterium]|nr:M28 family peptidase [Phycisphaerae bacterium]
MLTYRRWPRAAAVYLWILLPLTVQAADDGLGARRHSQNAALFSQAAYEKNVAHLASDDLEGRGTGQEGIDKAAEYIAAWFEKCGVEPAGDKETYFQNFTLKLSNRIGPGTRLAIGVRGRTSRKPAKLNEEFTPFPFSKSASFRGDVVFAGYGIVSDDLDYNDYGDLDVADKVVLILRRSPKFADFSEADMSFRAKASRASARDAAALIVVNPDGDEDSDKLYNFDGSAGAGFGFGGGSYGIPMIHVRRSVADRMLKAGGLGDVTSLQKRIESRKRPVSAALKGVSVRGRVNIEPVESPVRNVAGFIPGDGPQSDEIIVLGAHYDHLGIRHKGEDNFNPAKDISNGADDNASGTALIMTLADAYTRGERPNRSLLLLLFTGEERGLLGSHYFANHPTVDLKECVAMLNFDMVGRLKDDKLEVGGMRTGDFTEMVDRLAEPYGLAIKDGGGGSGPSDHTSFYNKDIPVLFFFTGIHKQYHRPEDDTHLLNIDGAIRIAKFAADCIDEIDADPQPPKFSEDTRRAQLARQDAEEEEGDAAPRRGRVRLGIMPSPDDTESGVLVAEVSDDSPAKRAGVREGDRIVKLGDAEIESFDDLAAALSEFRRGDTTRLMVRRAGKPFGMDVTFGRRGRRDARQVGDDAGERLVRLARELAKDSSIKVHVQIKDAGGEWRIEFSELDRESLGKVLDELITFLEESKSGGNYTISLGFEFPPGLHRITIQKKARVDSADAKSPTVRKQKERLAPDSHARAPSDDSGRNTMPGVRLGIMPTYGEATEDGYEISGVVEDGPAAKAGMKDSDRIYQIGQERIKDVYSYMEALRKYKAGDEVKVVVLRDGKKVTLTIKTAAQKSREAA